VAAREAGHNVGTLRACLMYLLTEQEDVESLESLWMDRPVRWKKIHCPSDYPGIQAIVSQLRKEAISSNGEKLLADRICQKPKSRSWNSELQQLENHSDRSNAVKWSPDGTLIASASNDHTIKIWEAETGELLKVLSGHSDVVTDLEFTPGGELLFSASKDNTFKVWEPTTGKMLSEVEPTTGEMLSGLEPNEIIFNGITISHDGLLIALASSDGIRTWSYLSGKLLWHQAPSQTGFAVKFSPDGNLLASGSDDMAVTMWEPTTGNLQFKLSDHSDAVTALEFSLDGKLLASGSRDKTVNIWNLKTHLLQLKLRDHIGGVTSVAFSCDGKLLASASYDRTTKIWNPVTGEGLSVISHNEWVTSVAFSPGGQLASAQYDGTIRTWDVKPGGRCDKRCCLQREKWAFAVALSHDKQLVASYENATVKLWDMSSGKLLFDIPSKYGAVTAISFSHDARLLAIASRDDQESMVTLWALKQVARSRVLFAMHDLTYIVVTDDKITTLAFSHNRELLALVLEKTIEICHVKTGHLLGKDLIQSELASTYDHTSELPDYSKAITSATFSPGSPILTSISSDDSITAWVSTSLVIPQHKFAGHWTPKGNLLLDAKIREARRAS
jgi:WD40 repeat protein